jgi:ppGpp synthetase/RelA/SpoT-type nucleotidyltranferase
MTSPAAEELRRYRSQFADCRDFAAHLIDRIETCLRDAGCSFEYVDGRAKEPASVFRKLLEKRRAGKEAYVAHGIEAFPDRVGVRVVTSCTEASEAVLEVLTGRFDLTEPPDRKSINNKPNELAYLGIHLVATLRSADLTSVANPVAAMRFEIQIHTLAEHAWAVASHPMVYKPFGEPLPDDVAGRVYRAVALVSIFDSEIQRAMTDHSKSPTYAAAGMLKAVDQLFARWRTEDSNDDLSTTVLDILKETYPQPFDLEAFKTAVNGFVEENADALDIIFEAHRNDGEELLLWQPESLVLAERLHNAKFGLRSVWVRNNLDPGWLDDIATAFGEAYA